MNYRHQLFTAAAGGLQLGSGLRRIVCLTALLFIFAIGARAVDYDLWVGGVRVSTSNASDITGTNIKAYDSNVNGGKASVVYNNSTKTLTLWNVSIVRTGKDNHAIENKGVNGLKIVLRGSNFLRAEDSSPVRLDANTTITTTYNGTTWRTRIEGGSEDAVYAAKNSSGYSPSITITDASFEITSRSSCFDTSCGASLTIRNSYVWAHCSNNKSGDCYAVFDYNSLTIQNSTVILYGYGQQPAIKNLTTLNLGTDMFISTPSGGVFSSSSKTVLNSSGTPAQEVAFQMGLAVNSTNFPNANFRNFILSQSYGSDGYLTAKEIQNVTTLTVSGKSISSLTGIEHFTELTSLNCSNNSLTSLDLSNNTKLLTLHCFNNQLTTLDLSENKSLKNVYCYGNKINGTRASTLVNNLPSTSGATLYFFDNETSTGNSMTLAQVETAKKKEWSVKQRNSSGDWIDYPGSDAIAINSTNFPDGNFRNYLLAQNYGKDGYLTEEEIAKIKQLDVSGRSISDLTGIEYFTALISLLCYDNNINEANMTKLVRSLPTGTYMRDLWVYKDGSSAEKNFFNLEHLNRAKDRYWSAMFLDGDTPAKFTDYVIYANFPDENFRSYVSTNLDKNGDGWLLPSEIAAVTEIDVNNKGISDLTGIEYFVGLEYLLCHDNNLTTLDVSKNKVLQVIACWGNQIRGEGMKTLVNSLHSNFVDNDWPEVLRPRLIVIKANEAPVFNLITEAQVEIATEKGWAVKKMDFSVGEVDYYGEPMGISISETNFPDDNFRAYVSSEDIDRNRDGYLSDDEIVATTEINVSYLNISDLKGIEFFNGLKELNCSYNQLTSLDVSNNTALTRLYCYSNRIRGTDMTKLVNRLPDRKSASEEGTLWVYYDETPEGNMMTTKQVKIAREKNWNVVMWDDDYEDFIPYEGETLDGIEISEANFPDDNFREYVGSKTIDKDEDGYLSDDEIAAATIIYVESKSIASLKGIEYFTALTSLRCFFNQLTELDVSKNTALEYLYCHDNQLKSLDVSKNTALIELACGSNQLTELNVSKNTQLTGLACDGNQLKSLDVSKNTALKWLFCEGNELTSLDVSKNTTLAELWCFNNLIRGKGMTDLVNSLPDRRSASEEGQMYVYRDETPAGNLMTPKQVEVATSMNWSVYLWDGDNYEWVPYEGETVPGDANGNGEVNAQDIATVRDYILGLDPQPFSFESANLNGDGAVDIQDLTQLIEILLKP